jgi:hypothetical protein
MKRCRVCEQDLPLSAYTKHRATRDGLRHECRDCRKKQGQEYLSNPLVAEAKAKRKKEYDQKNKERNAVYRKHKYITKDSTTIAGRAYSLYTHARGRASQYGLQFDLDREWVEGILEKGVCQVTGIPFVIDANDCEFVVEREVHTRSPFTPSIDKIDPTKGYTKDNCQVVVYMYNTCKNTFSDEAVKHFCRSFVNNMDGVIDGIS